METGVEVHKHILCRTEEDPEFRARLIADPKGVIEAEIGKELPDDVMVVVQEAIITAQEKLKLSSAEEPLTKDELRQVIGGSDEVDNSLPDLCDDDPPAWMNCD